LEAAVAQDPTLWDAQNALGIVYAKQNDIPAARKKFHEILQADPDNTDALLNEGILLYQGGRTEIARARFGRVLEIDPEHVRARSFLKQIEEEKK
jgi:lipoprotein NlpI